MSTTEQRQEEIKGYLTQLETLDNTYRQQEKGFKQREEALFNTQKDMIRFMDDQREYYASYLKHHHISPDEGWAQFQKEINQLQDITKERYQRHHDRLIAEQDEERCAYRRQRETLEDALEWLKRKED